MTRLLERSQTFVARRLAGRAFEPQAMTWEVLHDGLETSCPVTLAGPGETSWLARIWPRIASAARPFNALGVLRKLRPDVVHAHFGPAGGRVALACSILRIPLVTSFYGFDASSRAKRFVGRSELLALRMARATVTGEGPCLCEHLATLGIPRHSIRLLPLCLPQWALAEPVRTAGIHDPELHLLQVARFVEKKGIDTTLRALAEARRQGARVRLTLVGDGELRPALEALARELELGAAVTWTGFLPYSDLPRLLASAHAFIQPSRTAKDGDTEGGYPTTLIEAMAQRLPVIGTRHADIPLVVREGETGLLVPEGDSAAAAAAIMTLYRSRERLLYMSERARSMTLRRHDPALLLAVRERIYREARRAARRRQPSS